ncbi:cobalt-precorrin-4/precorrin-4 C(11)-methyltransferase [Actinopolyspora mortivallis]|uniref:Precorrin-4 C(11)-methyltransferase n=1 Tax=Actinopolyspora mortivallis TaxID=33906 RepID=A0A2T0GU07_ACTMO|nr:cobalt-precorrin-4/precorrin-4 C(11)-methyltransferase [Actinopolyspora mortivallis]PRW62580.1 precorrin-4 C(11)-methyltransferase [Actinopolyspora mortivallis]
MTRGTRTGTVSFVGAGPGAADLMTLRGARRIAEADVVLWSPSLVAAECVREHARGDAELVDTTTAGAEEVLEVYRRAERERLRVVRLYAEDPALWSGVQQQYDACSRMELEVELVPGVAGYSAAAAVVGREITGSSEDRSVLLARPDGGGQSLPAPERIREFAERGGTMALSVSAARTGQLVERLLSGGYGADVPVVVAYKVTCPDELVLRTNVGEVEGVVKRHRLWRHALFLVGPALRRTPVRARAYGSGQWETTRSSGRSRGSRRGTDGDSPRDRSYSASGSWEGPTGEDSRDGPLSRGGGRGQRGATGAEADVAWWAVRDWQRNARHTARPEIRGAAGRSSVSGEGQAPDLFTTSQDPEVAGVLGHSLPEAEQSSPVDSSRSSEAPPEDTVSHGTVNQVDGVSGAGENDHGDSGGADRETEQVNEVEKATHSATTDGAPSGAEPADTAESEVDETVRSEEKESASRPKQTAKTGAKGATAKSSGKGSGTKTGGRGKGQRKTTGSDASATSSGGARKSGTSRRTASGTSE